MGPETREKDADPESRPALRHAAGMRENMRLSSGKKPNRWLVLDQSFLAMFITFSMIELANVGAGLIDGLVVSNFLDAESMAAAGIAHPIFSISGIFGGMASDIKYVHSLETNNVIMHFPLEG